MSLVDGFLEYPLSSYDERRRLFLGVILLHLTIESSQDGSLETLASSKPMDPKWTDWLVVYPRDCARSPGLTVLRVYYSGEGWVLLRSRSTPNWSLLLPSVITSWYDVNGRSSLACGNSKAWAIAFPSRWLPCRFAYFHWSSAVMVLLIAGLVCVITKHQVQ